MLRFKKDTVNSNKVSDEGDITYTRTIFIFASQVVVGKFHLKRAAMGW